MIQFFKNIRRRNHGPLGARTGPVSLEALSDVEAPNPADGETLVYDDATGKWIAGSGGGVGDMTKVVYDPNTVEGDAFAMDNMVEGANTKILTSTERTAISNNTAKVTNATHTGEVTGSGALTVADNIIDEANLKLDTGPTNDFVLTADNTESGGMKWAEASGGGVFFDQMFLDSSEILTNSVIGFNLENAEYDSVSVSVNSQDTSPSGVTFKPDGTIMYIVGNSNDTIYQYTLSTPWVLSSASYASKSVSVSSQDTTPEGVNFKPDGTKMYVVGDSSNSVYQYSLSTAWDVSTATFDTGKSVSVSSQDSEPKDIFIKSDGTSFYIMGGATGRVFQYTMSTAWDISTGSYTSKNFSTLGETGGPRSVFFKDDGAKMYVLDSVSQDVFQYEMTVNWDVSTASYGSISFSSSEDSNTVGLWFGNNGATFYILGDTNNTVYQYSAIDSEVYKFVSFPASFDTKTISDIGVYVYDAGTGVSGTTDFDIESRTISGSTAGAWTSIFSTTLTLDFGEYDTRDAAVPAVISAGVIVNKNQYRLVVNGLSAADITGLGIWMDIA